LASVLQSEIKLVQEEHSQLVSSGTQILGMKKVMSEHERARARKQEIEQVPKEREDSGN
jgi:hypothetical protein